MFEVPPYRYQWRTDFHCGLWLERMKLIGENEIDSCQMGSGPVLSLRLCLVLRFVLDLMTEFELYVRISLLLGMLVWLEAQVTDIDAWDCILTRLHYGIRGRWMESFYRIRNPLYKLSVVCAAFRRRVQMIRRNRFRFGVANPFLHSCSLTKTHTVDSTACVNVNARDMLSLYTMSWRWHMARGLENPASEGAFCVFHPSPKEVRHERK